MNNAHFHFPAKLGFLLAATLPLLAQSTPVDLNDWAHPPVLILQATGNAAVGGLSPTDLLTAYGTGQLTNQGAGQTIALIDAFDNPNAEYDLVRFSKHFNLPKCNTANGCFKKIYATGTAPKPNQGWAVESSLDIEWAHAIAPQANIILVESRNNSFKSLLHAVHVAVADGATVVSMSWGGSEFNKESKADGEFSVSGVVFCASSGDSGHGSQYPAASPNVVAVGGTTLRTGSGGTWQSELAWAGSGGGASQFETEPSYQSAVQNTGMRGIPDVAYDADPATGVGVYSKYGLGGWGVLGGTSIGSPQWAALFAVANSARMAAGKANLSQVQSLLYGAAADFHDITKGSNGSCGAQCKAAVGYDFVTGIGTPQSNLLIPALVAAP